MVRVSQIKKRCIPSGPLSYRVARLHGCYASEIELLVLVPRVLLDLRPRGIIVSLRNRMAGKDGKTLVHDRSDRLGLLRTCFVVIYSPNIKVY